MKYKFILILLFISMTNILYSQYDFDNELFAVHPKLGYLYNTYNANFTHLQNSADCGLFKKGNGSGFSGLITLEKYIGNNTFITLSTGYFDRSGSLTVENYFPSRNFNNDIIRVNTENAIKINLSYLEISPGISAIIANKFINGPLRASAGIRIGFPINKNFTQSETIISPDEAVFDVNNIKTKKRNIANGNINDISSPVYGISFALENMLMTGKKSFLTQQITFDYNFNNITTDADCKVWSLRFELGFRIPVNSSKHDTIIPAPQDKNITDTLIVEKHSIPNINTKQNITEKNEEPKINPQLNVTIDNKIHNDAILYTGNELLASLPLVNAVFFEQNSYEIPKCYLDHKPDNLNYFNGNPVTLHNYILYKIVDIINNNPKATVILNGSTSGKVNESEGIKLAEKRANAVKQVLIKLGIDKNKIKIKSSILPQIPTSMDTKEGIAENQRTDIIIQDAQLQEFVSLQRFAEINGTASISCKAENIPVNHFAILRTNFNDSIYYIQNTNGASTYESKIPIIHRTSNDEKLFTITTNLEYENLIKSDTITISIDSLPKKQIELNLSNFEAILRFDFDKSELSDDNKILLKQMTNLLPDGSTIIIYGSADALGTEERNLYLTKARASSTHDYIKKITGNKFNIEINTNINKFPEDTPQGRFLNRSIRVKVK